MPVIIQSSSDSGVVILASCVSTLSSDVASLSCKLECDAVFLWSPFGTRVLITVSETAHSML